MARMTKEQRQAQEESRRASVERNMEEKRRAVEQARAERAKERPSRFDPVEAYVPLPVDHMALLDQFDTERAERESERYQNAEYRKLAEEVADKHDDAIRAVTKLGATPTGEKTPTADETGRAWDEVLETVNNWMDSDEFSKMRPELIQRLKNLLDAVCMDYNAATDGIVDKVLELNGYNN